MKYTEYNAYNLKDRVSVFSKKPRKNELTGKTEFKYGLEKKGVFASIRLIRRKKLEGASDTREKVVTHEVILRKKSVKTIDETYRFEYQDSYMTNPIMMEIISIDYDFDRKGLIKCYCEQVIE